MNPQTEDLVSESQKEYACFLEEMSRKEQKGKSEVKDEPSKEKRKALSRKYSKKVNVETSSESESSDVSSVEPTESTHTISGHYLVETPQTTRDVVCWGKDCIEQLIDPSTNTNKTFHKRVCLQGYTLPNVKENQPGDPALRQSSIFGSDGLCTTCKCSWQIHGHISYSQEKKTGSVQLTDPKTAADRALLSDELARNAESIIETEQKLNDSNENYPKVQA